MLTDCVILKAPNMLCIIWCIRVPMHRDSNKISVIYTDVQYACKFLMLQHKCKYI